MGHEPRDRADVPLAHRTRLDAPGGAGNSRRLRFIGYGVIKVTSATEAENGLYCLPLQAWTIDLRYEKGEWRLRTHHRDWLTDAGPVGEPGNKTAPSPEGDAACADARL